MIYIDEESISMVKQQKMNILFMKYPMILVFYSAQNMNKFRCERRYFHDYMLYPISLEEFCRISGKCVTYEIWKHRVLTFGRLQVIPDLREVIYQGERVMLNSRDFEIFLILIEHVGEVVSREYIDSKLPKRKRNSLRYVDVHIRSLRKKENIGVLIKSVRSVGYCNPGQSSVSLYGRGY